MGTRRIMVQKALCLLFFVAVVFGHSWVACTDYRPPEKADGVNKPANFVYEDKYCHGYPRHWDKYSGSAFGEDRGYNFQGDGCGAQNERTSPIESAYSSTYPMAKWAKGSEVCLAWPSKNHVAADGGACPSGGATNQYIPDGGVRLFYSAVNPDKDPTQDEFKRNEVLPFGRGVHTDGQVDFNGFQNCPNFCANNDKSMCNGCFKVPDLPNGV